MTGEDDRKTEICVPNSIFEAPERLATELGMSLSELYVAALAAYVATRGNGTITRSLDEGLREGGVLAGAGDDSDSGCLYG